MMSSFLSPDNYMQDPTSQQGFNRYAYYRYNPLKYVDPSGEQYFGWDPGLMYRVMQEIRGIILNAWYQHYDSSMASNKITQILASALYSCGLDSGGNGSGNHLNGTGGGSVEVKDLGNGKYEVVNGLYDGGNTVYVIDDQGNRTGEILGYTLTSWTFYKENGNLMDNVIIDINDSYGQECLDDFIDNTPSFFDYFFSDNTGFRYGYYDFKNRDPNRGFRYGMMVDFGFGAYITTLRDLGNFTAGYLGGVNGLPYWVVRYGMDMYQYITNHNFEPPVSSIPQNIGIYWGKQQFLINLFKYFIP